MASASRDEVCRLLEELRESAGLSQRELARRMKVGVATISSIEAGRQPRLSTLRKYVAQLPGATPRRLLVPESQAPEAAWDAAWETTAAIYRFAVDEVRVDFSPDRFVLEAQGVRILGEPLPALRLAALRAVCMGSAPVVRTLDLDSIGTTIEDGEYRHSYRARTDDSFDYRCELSTGRPAELLVEYPIQRLVLIAPAPSARAVRLDVIPTGQSHAPENNIARALHPDGVVVKAAGRERATVVVPRPVTWLRYIVSNDEEKGGAERRRRRDLARILTTLRRTHELSARGLGLKTGLRHSTIRELEAGSDPKVTTLQALLVGLPELRPQDVLGPRMPPACSSDELWGYQVRLFGQEALEHTMTVDISDAGRRSQVRTRQLRDLREREVLEIQGGRRRSVMTEAPKLLKEIEAGDQELTTKRVRLSADHDLYHFRFSNVRGGQGVSFSRRAEERVGLSRTLAEIRAREGDDRVHRQGAALGLPAPAQRCRLTLVFPLGFAPLDFRAHVWPLGYVPDEGLMACHHVSRHKVRRSRRGERLAIHLTFQRPMVGFSHAVSWTLR
ncbi:MAG: helix-turn-helix transcriptional regulator [Acidobacteriota bacterium]